MVRTLRTSNSYDVEGIRPTGQFRDRSGWFEGIEPHQNTVMQGEAGLLGSSGEFERLEPPQTAVM